jgi:hypothetical protein
MNTPSWASFLSFKGTLDGISRAIFVFILALVIVKYSTLFEEEYTQKLTNLYIEPWWRLLIVLLAILASMWCPRVGILMALLVFFYLADMGSLVSPIINV